MEMADKTEIDECVSSPPPPPSEEPSLKKRKRKQDNPKRLVDGKESPEDVLVGKTISKKMQQFELEKQRMKNVLTHVAKAEKKKVVVDMINCERFQDDLNNTDVLKSYSLNAFYFLGVSELVVDDVCEFKDFFLKTSATLEKLEQMEKKMEAYGMTQEDFRVLFLKYGKQYFKVNERDYDRLKTLKEMLLELKQQPGNEKLCIRAYLMDIHRSVFEDKKTGKLMTCLSPKLRFEISD